MEVLCVAGELPREYLFVALKKKITSQKEGKQSRNHICGFSLYVSIEFASAWGNVLLDVGCELMDLINFHKIIYFSFSFFLFFLRKKNQIKLPQIFFFFLRLKSN